MAFEQRCRGVRGGAVCSISRVVLLSCGLVGGDGGCWFG